MDKKQKNIKTSFLAVDALWCHNVYRYNGFCAPFPTFIRLQASCVVVLMYRN